MGDPIPRSQFGRCRAPNPSILRPRRADRQNYAKFSFPLRKVGIVCIVMLQQQWVYVQLLITLHERSKCHALLADATIFHNHSSSSISLLLLVLLPVFPKSASRNPSPFLLAKLIHRFSPPSMFLAACPSLTSSYHSAGTNNRYGVVIPAGSLWLTSKFKQISSPPSRLTSGAPCLLCFSLKPVGVRWN